MVHAGGKGWGIDGYIHISRAADDKTFTDKHPGDGVACKPFPKTQTVGGECGMFFVSWRDSNHDCIRTLLLHACALCQNSPACVVHMEVARDRQAFLLWQDTSYPTGVTAG